MFERMYIAEYIYEGVVKKIYKQSTRADATHGGEIRKKEEKLPHHILTL